MVDSAVSAGVEVIKHQTHIIEDEMSEEAKQIMPGKLKLPSMTLCKDVP